MQAPRSRRVTQAGATHPGLRLPAPARGLMGSAVTYQPPKLSTSPDWATEVMQPSRPPACPVLVGVCGGSQVFAGRGCRGCWAAGGDLPAAGGPRVIGCAQPRGRGVCAQVAGPSPLLGVPLHAPPAPHPGHRPAAEGWRGARARGNYPVSAEPPDARPPAAAPGLFLISENTFPDKGRDLKCVQRLPNKKGGFNFPSQRTAL